MEVGAIIAGHMEITTEQLNWYAIQVRPRSELAAAKSLQNKGFHQFVPRYKSKRKWSDRTVELELPLFPGYIFCRFNPQVQMPILATAGVIRIVGNRKMPLPIEIEEIEAVLQVIQSRYKVEPHPFVAIGTRVLIQSGPLAGLEGIVNGYKNRCLILSIGLIKRSIAIQLDGSEIAIMSFSTISDSACS
jgi:transcription termination/antitermination protein NusG